MTMLLAQPSTADGATERSSSDARPIGRIGPNAAIQLLSVLASSADAGTFRRILLAAGVPGWGAEPPAEMIDERLAAALHRATRGQLGRADADPVLARAGARTGDYILANRIPVWARAILKALPAPLASRLLVRAIAAHAWTFVGSGRFVSAWDDGLRLEVWSNPLCLGERARTPMCVWHAAVFERLFRDLVAADTHVVETHCCARGDPCCRFALSGSRS